MDNEVWLEFSFVIDHEDFSGEISVSRKVQGPVDEKTYGSIRQEVIQGFANRFVVIENAKHLRSKQ
jgi:hypothetical protein